MAIKDLLKNLEDETDLLVRLDLYLEKSYKVRPPDGCFHPSMVGGCPRGMYYYLTGVKAKTPDAIGIRRMDNGTKVHERLEGNFEGMGIMPEREKSISFTVKSPAPSIKVTGHCDGILKLGEKLLLEIKSCNSYGFAKYVKNGCELSHFLQWNLYSYGAKVWKGIILYENKDTQKLHPCYVKFDKKIFDECIKKFKRVQKALKAGKILPRPAKGMTDKMCLWCNYKDFCWEKK